MSIANQIVNREIRERLSKKKRLRRKQLLATLSELEQAAKDSDYSRVLELADTVRKLL